jgi:hypothetical protein
MNKKKKRKMNNLDILPIGYNTDLLLNAAVHLTGLN